MRNNFLIFFVFIFLISCADSKNDTIVDLDFFKNQGKQVDLFNDENVLEKEFSRIKKIDFDSYKKINSWKQSNFSSNNHIPNTTINIQNIKKKISKRFNKVISFKNYIAGIDENSNLIIIDKSYKIIKQKRIYKKKIYKSYKLSFSLLHINNLLILSDNLGNIRALDDLTLNQKWENKLSVPFISEIKPYKEQIFVINSNSKIYSFNIKDGSIGWSFLTSSKIVKGDNAYKISIDNDKLIFINDYAEIYCLDLKEKKILWTYVLQANNFKQVPTYFKSSSLVINDGILYLSSNYGLTYSININTGQIYWSIPIGTFSNILVQKKNILLTTNNNLVILKKKDGKIIFNKIMSYNKNKNKINSSIKEILVGDKYLYLFFDAGMIKFINKQNLKIDKEISPINSFNQYIIFNNQLLITSDNSLIFF